MAAISTERKFLQAQHTSGVKAPDGTDCINEIAPLPFAMFAEGFIRINALKDDGFTRKNSIKLIIPGQSEPFFEYTAERWETIFVPNLPYLKNVILSINDNLNVLDVKYPRGLYTVTFNNPTSSVFELQEVKKTTTLGINQFSTPLSLTSRITATFNPDGSIDATQKGVGSDFVMVNQSATQVAHLQISNLKTPSVVEKHDSTLTWVKKTDQNLVLTWVLEAHQTIKISLRELKDKWNDTYKAVKGDYVSNVDNLQLHAIGCRTYEDIPPPSAKEVS